MIFIAIGSNLSGPWGDSPLKMCQEAVRRVSLLPFWTKVNVSSWYQSSPVPPSDQPLYINGVLGLEGEVEPLQLLERLQQLEVEAGRKRTIPNAARTIDLDIIAVNDDLIHEGTQLIVPHPRMHERGFVLFPLRDVMPTWCHPALHKTVDELIQDLPKDQIIQRCKVITS